MSARIFHHVSHPSGPKRVFRCDLEHTSSTVKLLEIHVLAYVLINTRTRASELSAPI